MRVWHYTDKEGFYSILKNPHSHSGLAVAFQRADNRGEAILNFSLQQMKGSRPDGVDAHYGDGIYVTDIRPGSMKMADICKKLWGPRVSGSSKYLERVKYHFQFEVGELLTCCRPNVYKLT